MLVVVILCVCFRCCCFIVCPFLLFFVDVFFVCGFHCSWLLFSVCDFFVPWVGFCFWLSTCFLISCFVTTTKHVKTLFFFCIHFIQYCLSLLSLHTNVTNLTYIAVLVPPSTPLNVRTSDLQIFTEEMEYMKKHLSHQIIHKALISLNIAISMHGMRWKVKCNEA